MNSPISQEPMERVSLEDSLTAYRCQQSGGYYIPAQCYWNWLQDHPNKLSRLPVMELAEVRVVESETALICPESGMIMTRYRVGHGFSFSIDRSVSGGIWLDTGEWEALKSRNFHQEIHLVFTAPWQDNILNEQLQQSYDERLHSTLGTDMVEKLKALKNELDGHSGRELALTFLSRG